MRRSILRIAVLILLNGSFSNTHANSLNLAEQQWIDAHPVVRFSIHEKYAPYLDTNEKGESGVFHATKGEGIKGKLFTFLN